MPTINLTDAELEAVAALLCRAIKDDKFPHARATPRCGPPSQSSNEPLSHNRRQRRRRQPVGVSGDNRALRGDEARGASHDHIPKFGELNIPVALPLSARRARRASRRQPSSRRSGPAHRHGDGGRGRRHLASHGAARRAVRSYNGRPSIDAARLRAITENLTLGNPWSRPTAL
jgi:hypothetical protein